MIDPHYCQVMANYNAWMNQKLYALCSEISDAERKRDRGAFFQSIHGTLNHLLYGDRAWLGRFTGQSYNLKGLGEILYDDFDKLQQARSQMDQDLLAWTQQISVEWLRSPFEYTSRVDRQTRILPTWVLVAHLFNHQTHHRGQLTTLLSQMGYDPGVTDLPWLPSLIP